MPEKIYNELMSLNFSEEAEKYFLQKLTYTISPLELTKLIYVADKFNIVDVRQPEDYAQGHIPGAKNLPEKNWNALFCLDNKKINIFYCYSPHCHLAARAAYTFAKLKFHVMELEGGFEGWKKYNLEIESI